MNKYLIAIDMDGTLLKADQSVSDFTINIIKKLSSLGHKIVIASGRPLRTILDTYNLLELDTPVIAYNGGAIYGVKSSFKDEETYLPIKDVLTVLNSVDFDIFENYICETPNKIYVLKDNDTFLKWFAYEKMEIIEGNLNETLKEPPLSIIYKVKNQDISQLKVATNKLSNNLDIRFWSGGYFAELYNKKINKFSSLEKIAKFYNIKKEFIISFGDASNDIPLMEGSEISVAMLNGIESIKDYSKYVTKYDNNNDGVAHYLKEFFKL